MANGSTRYIIKYVGDVSDVLAKIKQVRFATNTLGKTAAKNIAPFTQAVERTVTPLNNAAKAAVRADKGMKGLIGRALKTIPVWFALRAVFTSVLAVIKSSIKFLIDWEAQLAEIRIVGESTAGQIQVLSNGLLNLQRTLGISNKELGLGAKLFRQQGRAIEEIIPLLDATARLSLITGRSITQSTEDLTAIQKAFNIEARDSITIVDKLTAVTLQNAITAGDLTSALKQSASTAATFGVSLDELVGFITAIQTQTRDTGNTVGRSLRTIFVRLGTVATDTAQQISKVPFFLDQMGQATTQNTPRLRNLTNIITELAANFRTLDTAQKAQLASAVAGVRRSNQISALFQNFDQFIRSQVQAQFGLGESDRAISILTETTASKIEQVKGAWVSLVDTFADTSAFKGALDSLKDTLDSIRLAIDPQGTFENSLISQLDKDIANLSRQKAGIKSIFTEINNLRDLNASINRNPNDEALLGFSLIRLREVQNAIRRLEAQTGQRFEINGLDDVRDTFELLEVLEKNTSQLRNRFIDINVQTNANEATSTLVSNLAVFRQDLESTFGKTLQNALNRASKGFKVENARELDIVQKVINDLGDPRNNDKVISNLSNISELLKTFSIPEGDLNTLINDINKVVISRENINKSRQIDEDLALKELEVQKKAASETLVQEQLKQRLLDIDRIAVVSQENELSVLNKKIELLKSAKVERSKEQTALLESLTIQRERVLVARELAREQGQEERVLSQLEAQGASLLQIEQQRLAFIRQRDGAGSVKAINQENKVRELALTREQQIQNTLLGLSSDLLSLEGRRKSEILASQIELEKRLGIEKKGIDALSQQVELLKELRGEQSAANREQELSNLQKAIRQRRRDTSPIVQQRLANREADLRAQAEAVGLDPDQFLTNNEKLIAQTENNVQALLRNVDSTSSLTGAVQTLTQAFVQGETRLSAEQRVRASVASQLQGPVGLRRTSTQPTALPVAGQLPNVNLSPALIGNTPSSTSVNVNVTGQRQIGITLNATDAQIRTQLREQLQIENQELEDRLVTDIISSLRDPNHPLTKQLNTNIERN